MRFTWTGFSCQGSGLMNSYHHLPTNQAVKMGTWCTWALENASEIKETLPERWSIPEHSPYMEASAQIEKHISHQNQLHIYVGRCPISQLVNFKKCINTSDNINIQSILSYENMYTFICLCHSYLCATVGKKYMWTLNSVLF